MMGVSHMKGVTHTKRVTDMKGSSHKGVPHTKWSLH